MKLSLIPGLLIKRDLPCRTSYQRFDSVKITSHQVKQYMSNLLPLPGDNIDTFWHPLASDQCDGIGQAAELLEGCKLCLSSQLLNLVTAGDALHSTRLP